jgi:hypothetical protein
VIHDGPVTTLGEEAIAYSMVTKYLRDAQISRVYAIASSDAISPHIDHSDDAILRAFEERLFSSVQQLSCATYLQKARYTGDSLRNSGSRRVISDGCHMSCRTIRTQDGWNRQGSFSRYGGHNKSETGQAPHRDPG